MSKPVSIILPTYNEKGTIERLIKEIIRRIPQGLEIIVVDDDSPDGTGDIVAHLSRSNPQIRLRRRQTRGLTSALRDGIEAAHYDTVIWMDADFAHPPEVLPRLLEEPDRFDIVVASRYIRGGSDGRKSLFRRLVSFSLNRFGRWFVRSSLKDLSSGFLRVRKKVLSQVPLRGTYGDYCIDFLVRAEKMGYAIKEIPFTNAEREDGYSKTTPNLLIFFRYALIYLLTLLNLRRKRETAG